MHPTSLGTMPFLHHALPDCKRKILPISCTRTSGVTESGASLACEARRPVKIATEGVCRLTRHHRGEHFFQARLRRELEQARTHRPRHSLVPSSRFREKVTTRSERTSWLRFVFCRSRRMCTTGGSLCVEVFISKGGGRMETRKYRDAELVCQVVASDGTWLAFEPGSS
jgi:hypothetical protein